MNFTKKNIQMFLAGMFFYSYICSQILTKKLKMKNEKLIFMKRLEAAKSKLPKGIIPIYMTRHPKANRARVGNVLAYRSFDFDILEKIEELAKIIKK